MDDPKTHLSNSKLNFRMKIDVTLLKNDYTLALSYSSFVKEGWKYFSNKYSGSSRNNVHHMYYHNFMQWIITSMNLCDSYLETFFVTAPNFLLKCYDFWVAGGNYLQAPTSKNCQTHSNNSLAVADELFWVCLTILWGWLFTVTKYEQISIFQEYFW